MTFMVYTNYVPSFMLLSKSAQKKCLGALLLLLFGLLIYMALAIDISDGRGLSNKACHELLLKKEQGNAVLAFLFAVNNLYITNKTECFSLNSGRDVRVSKHIKEGWPMVLW